ncbi:AAA family ATPase [archaeon]|jgi:chromosome partitioning protein|nr:AAA family ATPase [archaeon]
MKPITIAIAQSKGGVAKTTTAWALSSIITKEYDLKVLLVDMDPQRTLTMATVEKHSCTIYDLLAEKASIDDAISSTAKNYGEQLQIIPASNLLTGLEAETASKFDRQYLLSDVLKSYQESDLIIIDCPSSQGILTVASLTAADYVLTPVPTAPAAYSQVSKFQKTVELVSNRMNPNLKQLPYLACIFDGRNSLDKEVLAELQRSYATFNTTILKRVRIQEEMTSKEACTNQEYRLVVKELLREVGL